MDDLGIDETMFKDIYRNKKVLVTGNTGFKGSWLTIWLLKLGAKVYGISLKINDERNHFKLIRSYQNLIILYDYYFLVLIGYIK